MLSSATLQPSNPAISTTSAAICRGLVVLKDAAFSISWTFFQQGIWRKPEEVHAPIPKTPTSINANV